MKFFVSDPPHEISPVTTRRLMLNVVLALVPAAAMGVYNFGLPALWVLNSAQRYARQRERGAPSAHPATPTWQRSAMAAGRQAPTLSAPHPAAAADGKPAHAHPSHAHESVAIHSCMHPRAAWHSCSQQQACASQRCKRRRSSGSLALAFGNAGKRIDIS